MVVVKIVVSGAGKIMVPNLKASSAAASLANFTDV